MAPAPVVPLLLLSFSQRYDLHYLTSQYSIHAILMLHLDGLALCIALIYFSEIPEDVDNLLWWTEFSRVYATRGDIKKTVKYFAALGSFEFNENRIIRSALGDSKNVVRDETSFWAGWRRCEEVEEQWKHLFMVNGLVVIQKFEIGSLILYCWRKIQYRFSIYIQNVKKLFNGFGPHFLEMQYSIFWIFTLFPLN